MGYLTRDNPPLEAIGPQSSIIDAVEKMCEKDYSQLPVVKENGETVGAVTRLSFLQGLLQQLARRNDGISEIMKYPVETFMVPERTLTHTQPHESILDRINILLEKDSRKSFILIDSQNKCTSIATKSNVLHFFENKARVFLLLMEIEACLRYIIGKFLTQGQLEGTLDRIRHARKERNINVPVDGLEDLSFDELKSVMNMNWLAFQSHFKNKDKTNEQLEYTRDLRNRVFHFRDKIGFSEINHVNELRGIFFRIAEEPTRILLVCSGNELRSKAGEELLGKVEGLDVKSAGTLPSLSPQYVEISKDLVEWADIIFAMEKIHKDGILTKSPGIGDKIIILDIPDDYSSRSDPELVAKLKDALSQYFPEILKV